MALHSINLYMPKAKPVLCIVVECGVIREILFWGDEGIVNYEVIHAIPYCGSSM